MTCRSYISLILLLCCFGCHDHPESIHPYRVNRVLDAPIEFANGDIKTLNGISFSNDGASLYISGTVEDTFTNGRSLAAIYRVDFMDSIWLQPKKVDLGVAIDAYHPVLSPDNQTLLFNSRSHPDTMNLSIPHNIWFSKKSDEGWSVPEMINGLNSASYDSYPSIAHSNNIYFNSDRPGGKGGMDIYMSRLSDGIYKQPINLSDINSGDVENDLVIDPDERFIIFNRYFASTNQLDMFISFNNENKWTTPVPLDIINRDDKWELTPSLSPDGKYFFYEQNSKIMQIDLSVLLDQQ